MSDSPPPLMVCISCGSKRVSVRLRNGRTVTGVKADVCAGCGERHYDLEAMQRLEARSDHVA